MKKPRLMVVIPDAMRELQADLELFPKKDRAARLRLLAMTGLLAMKGGVAPAVAPVVGAAVASRASEEVVSGAPARVRRLPPGFKKQFS